LRACGSGREVPSRIFAQGSLFDRPNNRRAASPCYAGNLQGMLRGRALFRPFDSAVTRRFIAISEPFSLRRRTGIFKMVIREWEGRPQGKEMTLARHAMRGRSVISMPSTREPRWPGGGHSTTVKLVSRPSESTLNLRFTVISCGSEIGYSTGAMRIGASRIDRDYSRRRWSCPASWRCRIGYR
jgi:hypothetical protein